MRPVQRVLRAAILAGPSALAFASGGYFDHARLIALIVAWALATAAVPLTYWNAEGALAALGLILCARIAGDNDRRRELRAAAAAAAVPLAAGVYLSFSRGALAALAAGVIVLLVAAPSWIQLRAAAITLEAGAMGAGACAAFDRNAVAFVLLLALMALAAAFMRWEQRAERAGTTRLG